jgi:pyridoxine/pyridoxamine 5'-phosphate oxidase
MSIADLRRDYRARALSEADAAADPLVFFRQWSTSGAPTCTMPTR